MPSGDQAHLRSHSGLHASSVLLGAPTSQAFEVGSADFRTLVLQRLGLPLALTDSICEGCGAALDSLGLHRGACVRSGRLKLRAKPAESAMAAVCREAGALVKTEVRLRDLNVDVPTSDMRRIDVLADHLPCRQGRQLAIDVTVRSPLTAFGEPRPRAAAEDGAVAGDARADKVAKCPELVQARHR